MKNRFFTTSAAAIAVFFVFSISYSTLDDSYRRMLFQVPDKYVDISLENLEDKYAVAAPIRLHLSLDGRLYQGERVDLHIEDAKGQVVWQHDPYYPFDGRHTDGQFTAGFGLKDGTRPVLATAGKYSVVASMGEDTLRQEITVIKDDGQKAGEGA